MYPIFFVLNIIHRLALICLLIAFSVVPLLAETTIFSSYVLLPTIFIVISISTIYIENSLNKYKVQLTVSKKSKKQKKCLIRYGICCLHH